MPILRNKTLRELLEKERHNVVHIDVEKEFEAVIAEMEKCGELEEPYNVLKLYN